MRRFGSRYRGLSKFMLRRLDHAAGEVNGVLIVAAIGLAMLDFLVAAQKIVDALPPVNVPAP